MSSEAITRNDLTAILNEVLPPTASEYRKLLWANPSPTSSFSAQTLSVLVSDYDEIAIEYSDNTAYQGIRKTVLTKAGATSTYIFSCAGGNFARGITVTTTSVSFNDGMYYGSYGGANPSTNNSILIPIAIYGIKYERVNPPQISGWELVATSTGSNQTTFTSLTSKGYSEFFVKNSSCGGTCAPIIALPLQCTWGGFHSSSFGSLYGISITDTTMKGNYGRVDSGDVLSGLTWSLYAR